VGLFYEFQVVARCTSVRTVTPEGPLAMKGLASSSQAVPAMSRWTQGAESMDSLRKGAVLMVQGRWAELRRPV
jgi:hypothetical protein